MTVETDRQEALALALANSLNPKEHGRPHRYNVLRATYLSVAFAGSIARTSYEIEFTCLCGTENCHIIYAAGYIPSRGWYPITRIPEPQAGQYFHFIDQPFETLEECLAWLKITRASS